jgi:hypothetical protein
MPIPYEKETPLRNSPNLETNTKYTTIKLVSLTFKDRLLTFVTEFCKSSRGHRSNLDPDFKVQQSLDIGPQFEVCALLALRLSLDYSCLRAGP